MIKHLLSSVAAFSPPDELGSGGTDTPIIDNQDVGDTGGGEGSDNSGQDTPTDHATPRKETITESVRRALKETKEKAAAPKAAPKSSTQASGADTAAAGTAKPVSDPATAGNTEAPPQGKSGAPAAWKAEEKALWDSLPDAARSAITRREADAEKGVRELRSRYTEIDTAIAPYSAVMRQNNVTAGQAINQLFKWHMELAGPNKVQAARTLLQNFNIDPATLAAAPVTGAQPGADPNGIPENLKPIISGLETRIKGFEDQTATQNRIAAEQTWQNWSSGKTHAETVRGLMAQLINGDLALIQAGQPQVSNTINPQTLKIDMDKAYEAAIYAHPQVRATVLQEEQAKRDTAARDAAAKARKAGAGLRPGAPAGKIQGTDPNAPRTESPRDSIKRALAEVRGTQH